MSLCFEASLLIKRNVPPKGCTTLHFFATKVLFFFDMSKKKRSWAAK